MIDKGIFGLEVRIGGFQLMFELTIDDSLMACSYL